LPKNNHHCNDQRTNCVRALKTAPLTLIFVGNGPHASTTQAASIENEVCVASCSAGHPLARGPIGSNRSNRLRTGPGVCIGVLGVYLIARCNSRHKTYSTDILNKVAHFNIHTKFSLTDPQKLTFKPCVDLRLIPNGSGRSTYPQSSINH